jgi:membrane protease YdiL (CAAX protease family)
MDLIRHFLATNSWYDLALLGFAALVMPAMSLMAGRQLARDEQASLLPRYGFTMARGWIAAGAVLLVWYGLRRPFAALGLDIPVSFRGQIGFACDAALAIFFVFQWTRLQGLSRDKLEKAQTTIKRLKIVPRTAGELAVFMAVAITAGVWEELLYRGFLIWLLAPAVGLADAVVLSAVFFGIGHAYQGWRGVLTTGLVGLVFAILYVLSNSLWWLILAHALIDIYGGLAAFQLRRLAAHSPSADSLG